MGNQVSQASYKSLDHSYGYWVSYAEPAAGEFKVDCSARCGMAE